MQTIKLTPYQTIQANARKLRELAKWYAETAAAEHLEAGRQTNTGAAQFHTTSAQQLGQDATRLESLAGAMDRILECRNKEAAKPAIEKTIMVDCTNFPVLTGTVRR